MNRLRLITCSLIAFLLIIILSNPVSAEVQEIDIVTTPEKVLFDITNMKPGDWAIRDLKIKNSGKQDFDYLFSSNKKSGSTQLYNELFLTVTRGDTELYKGKLGGFSKLDTRSLKSGAEERLTLRVDFPEHLGNEYQRLTTEVEFKFYVEGTLGGVLPVDGPKLPNTGTDMFNILVAGALLILTGTILQFVLAWRRKIAKHG
ncbi:LPXTG cell wall anchor domain-containing protein [Bacillus sp. sid0103]|uniref:LPXTG cell wall anchor domain-containing protein n=1 Tax=Bacillus sp. sid0103 TaxID=2856337 RepID=UPI001C4689A8|nr:LPXTG cell wall anchor domain-containing protein [Bacillus sp. sid0103]MBV7508064.1 LPXTG cell wall anchor domain-containing protein [Bacillus sp. sid0103]